MKNYNNDYFVMLIDYTMSDPLTYSMGDYGALRIPEMRDTHFSQPIRFNIVIDEKEGESFTGREPDDVILNAPFGLILKREIMEEDFLLFNQEGTIVHSAYIVSPDNKYFEGYVFIPMPIKPLEWFDKEKSTLVLDDEYDEADADWCSEILSVDTYSLNSLILDQIEELHRCFFTWSAQDLGVPVADLIHKKVVDILIKQRRNIKFIPLADYHIAMALGGRDFPDSAI